MRPPMCMWISVSNTGIREEYVTKTALIYPHLSPIGIDRRKPCVLPSCWDENLLQSTHCSSAWLIYRWSNVGSMIVAHIKHISYAFSNEEVICRRDDGEGERG